METLGIPEQDVYRPDMSSNNSVRVLMAEKVAIF